MIDKKREEHRKDVFDKAMISSIVNIQRYLRAVKLISQNEDSSDPLYDLSIFKASVPEPPTLAMYDELQLEFISYVTRTRAMADTLRMVYDDSEDAQLAMCKFMETMDSACETLAKDLMYAKLSDVVDTSESGTTYIHRLLEDQPGYKSTKDKINRVMAEFRSTLDSTKATPATADYDAKVEQYYISVAQAAFQMTKESVHLAKLATEKRNEKKGEEHLKEHTSRPNPWSTKI